MNSIYAQAAALLAAALIIDRLLRRWIKRNTGNKLFRSISPGVAAGIIRGFVFGLAFLTVLDLFGISVTPILASLGIGSLAVALALQDTLSNFFAGVYVGIDRPVRAGDFVKLEGGVEGYVVEVGWRSTRIRTLPDNVVIIPNTKLMGGAITNYHLPDTQLSVTVEMSVHYDSDLARVERVATETARDVIKRVQGGVPDFDPVVRFHTFGDSGIGFTAVLRGKEYMDNFTIRHEFIKAVHERFRKEGLVIPYPTRTIELSEAAAARIGGLKA